MPPAPSGPRTSYAPSREPAASVIPISVGRTGSGPARIAAGPAGSAGSRRGLARSVRHGEDGDQPVHPPAFALGARDPALPADEPFEASLALPAPVLVDRHHFTI